MKIFSLMELFSLISCSTTFKGDAQLTPKQCEAKCESWDMELDGMVAMGEYSDACVCKKNAKTSSVGSVGAGAVGVVLQMKRNQARASTPSL